MSAQVHFDSDFKHRQRAMWASADFAVIGTTLQIVAETLCEAVDLRSVDRVLDLGCGSGNAAIAAARRFARVTGVDYVPALLDKMAARASAEGVAIEAREADVEVLPFASASFDVVLSTFGVMFAPNHRATAAEIARVCRPGGRIALASWTPSGFVGELLRLVGRYVPAPPGLLSPALWGTREHLANVFGDMATATHVASREFQFRYESAAHFIELFRTYYGPTHKAFAALDGPRRVELAADLDALLQRFDRGRSRGLVVPGEYLEVVMVRNP